MTSRVAHEAPTPDESESRFRTIFDHSNDAIFIIDPEGGALLDVNGRACQMLEYSREELLSLTMRAIHPHDLDTALRFTHSVLEAGSGWTAELSCRKKTGEIVPAEISASVVETDGKKRLLAMVRDVSERKRVEQTLCESEERFKDLYESAPHAYNSAGPDGRLKLVNRRTAELLGISRDELIGRSVIDLYADTPDGKEKAKRLMLRARAGEELRDEELQMRRADGTPVWVALTVHPVRNGQGEIAEMRGIVVDISERKRMEAALRSARDELELRVLERTDDLTRTNNQLKREIEERERAENALRRSEERHRALLQINNAVVTNLDRESLFAAIARSLKDVVPFDRAALTLRSTSPGSFTVCAWAGDLQPLRTFPVGTEFRNDQSRIGWVLEHGRPARMRDMREEPAESPERRLAEEGLRSAVSAPLLSKGRVIGALNVGSLRIDQYSEEDADFLTEVGKQLALAIENMLAHEEIGRLKGQLEQENIYLKEEISIRHNLGEILGHSASIKRVVKAVETVAATDTTVLITGETGTGKELVARAVHKLSARGKKAMVTVNCAALPAGLIESEFFGHEKGAFTGAATRKIGRFELADGGTLFLDEVGDIPMELQAKLLRALQEGEFERVGGSYTIKVDVRVIAATNHDLEKAMQAGKFRPDLFYRLNVFPITLPPLRDRKEDIPVLVRHLVMKHAAKLGKRVETIPQAAMEALGAYPWPGNVRELENIIERAVILSHGPQLGLGEWLRGTTMIQPPSGVLTLEERERKHIVEVLELTRWRVSGEKGAARLLGLKPTTLEARMRKLGVHRPS